MTTSLTILVYLAFMLVILVAAAHFTKAKPVPEPHQAESPLEASVVESAEFSKPADPSENAVKLLFPHGKEQKLTPCFTGDTDVQDVQVYMAEGITLIIKTNKLVNY